MKSSIIFLVACILAGCGENDGSISSEQPLSVERDVRSINAEANLGKVKNVEDIPPNPGSESIGDPASLNKPKRSGSVRISEALVKRLADTAFTPTMNLTIGRELGVTAREEIEVNSAFKAAWARAKAKRVELMEGKTLKQGGVLLLPKLDEGEINEIRAALRASLPSSVSKDVAAILDLIFYETFGAEFENDLELTIALPPTTKRHVGGGRRFSPVPTSLKYIQIRHPDGELEAIHPQRLRNDVRFDYLEIDPKLLE